MRVKRKKYVLAMAVTVALGALTARAGGQLLHFDSGSGLSNNYVLSIAQDNKGFVWLATESGLNRFDGTSFRRFDRGELGLAADEIQRLTADGQGRYLWICTQRNGLDRLDCDTYEVTHYSDGPEPGQLASNGITDAEPAPDGKVWVSTYTSGLDRLDPATGEIKHFNTSTVSGWPDNSLWTVMASADGKLYLGHVAAGLTVFNPATGALRNFRNNPADPESLPGDQVRAVAIDSHGNVWAGTNRGLALYNPDEGNFTVFRHDPLDPGSLVSDNIYHLSFSRDGRLWISTENGGVSTLDLGRAFLPAPGRGGFVNYTPATSESLSVSNKTVHVTFQDSYGNIWVGTHGDGVDVIGHRPGAVSHLHTASHGQRVSDNSVMSVCTDGQTVYAGTDGAGIDVFGPGRAPHNINSSNSALRDNAVLALMRASDGRVWAGSYNGDVSVIDRDGRLKLYDIPGSVDVRCFAETPDGTMLVGAGPGIVQITPDGDARPLWRERDDVREEWVRSIVVLPDGDIWVGSFGYGISIFAPGFKFRHKLSVSNGLRSNTINQMLVRPDGRVWAATGDGLALIGRDGRVDTMLTVADGLPDKAVKALVPDRQGRLWMSTPGGISMVDDNLRVSNYSRGYGLGPVDYYGASAAAVGDTLYFGSHHGLYSFAAGTLSDTSPAPVPRVTEVTVYGRTGSADRHIYAPVGALKFAHNDNTLLVRFGVPDASTASAVEWSYKVEGVDDRWYPASPDNGILLHGLRPGRYRLVIRASMSNSAEDARTVLTFEIKPPLWATTWARILYLLLALGAVAGVMRFYKKRLNLEYALEAERGNSRREHELNAERMRFFTNITHELRTPLTLILGPLEDMKNDPAMPRSQAGMLGMVHKSAARLLELINTILEFRKTETQNRRLKVTHADLATVVREAGARYRSLNTVAALDIHTEIEPGDYTLWHDPEIVAMIVDNLMSNACKYTPAGTVTLRLSHTSESGVPFTEISVADTGLGMDAETLSHIFDRYYRDSNTANRLGTGIGLALVYNLVTLHQGEIFVESHPGQGSVFRFRIHTENTYPEAARKEPGTNRTPAETPQAAAAEADRPADKPHVLVVDDNADILTYMQATLGDSYCVDTATDGAMGLAKARSLAPDIIVTDVMMPGMSGTEMIAALRADNEISHIPVVVVTAKIADEARLEAYECGADSFITKPFSSKILRARIRNILDTRRRMAVAALDAQLAAPVASVTEQPAAETSADTAPAGAGAPAAETDANAIISKMTTADSEFLRKVGDIILADIAGEKLDVGFIADRMCMSHSTLYRKVKAITGMSVSRLIRKYRANRAAELLLTGRYTVSEIALMVGMGSPANFRQCFREEYGTTPSDYLQRHRP